CCGTGLPSRAGTAVLCEADEPHVLDRGRKLTGTIGRSVVDDDNLVAVVGDVHRGAYAVDLLPKMLDFVVDGQDDRYVERSVPTCFCDHGCVRRRLIGHG